MPDDRLAVRLAHHARQASWTKNIRAHLYRRLGAGAVQNALDVGCGGGLLTAELSETVRDAAVGCDIDPGMIAAARECFADLSFETSGPVKLPFPAQSFDLVCCHFVLMWAADPVALLTEMKRVTRPQGALAALAEPDWGGYLSWPDQGLNDLLCVALAAEGADPLAGRKLRDWFGQAGLEAEVGISAGPWVTDEAGLDGAWEHHRLTLAGTVNERKLRVMERKERRAWREGKWLAHLPLVWATAKIA